nr:Cytidine and deoxycytidylate deaminase zinc-binding region [uncultured bacterium]
MDSTSFKWGELAFGSKKPVNDLQATFIAATREMSDKRFKQLIKTYLPHGNIVLGISEEPYVLGFRNQPHFKMSQHKEFKNIIDIVNANSERKIYTLEYSQRDLKYVLDKIRFKRAAFINGSWKFAFHTLDPFYVLIKRSIPYELLSPFADEDEARLAEKFYTKKIKKIAKEHLEIIHGSNIHNDYYMLLIADLARINSFDYNFQTGVSLGKKLTKDTYTYLTSAYNKVVPYETYAMHFGASRERNFSPPNDLNHYDTVHAEVMLILKAAKEQINLSDTTLFINLLPCPSCSRMLAETPIKEIVYSQDHSNGYAVQLLESAGKTVRRVITEETEGIV